MELAGALLAWFGENARDLPWRRTSDPYAIWISEVMLQQTQVKTVIAYWTRWMKRFPDAQALARARPQAALKLWEGLGYYARVRNLHAAAQVIAQKFAGQFPSAFDDVLGLPGVGRYTAGAICSIAFNQPRPIVDGNVARVLCRIFGIGGDPREIAVNAQLWRLAQELVEAADSQAANASLAEKPPRRRTCAAFNQALMELGALVCAPLQPKCAGCPARRQCFARESGRVEDFPFRKPAAPLTPRRFIAFIVEKDNQFLARQRPAEGVNANFWEFPNLEIGLRRSEDLATLARPFALTEAGAFCRISHTITRYRIELTAYRAHLPNESAQHGAMGVWRTVAQMRRMPFTSAHRRILERLADDPGPKSGKRPSEAHG